MIRARWKGDHKRKCQLLLLDYLYVSPITFDSLDKKPNTESKKQHNNESTKTRTQDENTTPTKEAPPQNKIIWDQSVEQDRC